MVALDGPRLLPAPVEVRDPELADCTEWAGVDVTGEVGGEQEVDDVDVSSSRLACLRLTGRRIDHLRLVDVLVEDCELSGVNLPAAYLLRVEFRRCRLSGLSAPNLRARHVRFTDCRADGASFRMSTWESAELSEVNLREADFHAARLPGARLLGCDLTGADFSKATMAGAALHGSTLEGIRGAGGLKGVVIGGDQVIGLALPLFAALDIRVDDDYLDPDGGPPAGG